MRNPKNKVAQLSPTEIRVSLHEFLDSMIGESHCELAVLSLALDTDDGPCAVSGMAHTLADQRIGSPR